ncbi:hypothetical protein BGX33_002298 [Mortierella sp. NVP41]|nr:hypothetical protein BGX33_002298 [Mortierella sp. NVP41]
MPKNGRIAPEDFAVMKTLLSNLRRGPKVGLIITQVKKKQMEECKSSVYYHNVMNVLRQTEVDTKFFEQHRWLILKDHEDDFGDEDKRAIRDYVFSFVPQTVKVGSLLASMLQDFLQFIKKLKHLFE